MESKNKFKTNEGVKEYTSEELFFKSKNLIHKLTCKFIKPNNQDYEDLFQLACVAFMQAVNTYDIKKNICFNTYMGEVILNELKEYFRYNHRNKRDVNVLIDSVWYSEGEEFNYLEFLVDSKVNIEEDTINNQFLNEVLDKMSERTKQLFLYNYFYNYTQTETCQVFNISRSYMNQIIKKEKIRIQKIYQDIVD